MAYYQDHRYYKPCVTNYPPRFAAKKTSQKPTLFQSVFYLFLGFIITYSGLWLAFEREAYFQNRTASEKEISNTLITKIEQTEQENRQVLSAQTTSIPQASPPPQKTSFVQNEQLLKKIEAEIPTDNGEYAIAIKQADGTGEQAFINADTVYPSGSLYKLYVMAAALEKVDKGEWDLKTIVTGDTSHLEEILGSVDFGYEDKKGKKISYTLEETLGRIARVSDNYASIMLAEKLDWEYVRDFAKRIGAKNTVIKSPISTTAEDTLHFFDLLYQKKMVSEKQSDFLIDLLATAQLNQRIPAKLPKSKLKIAHKTGELPGVRHDAGIVFLEKTEKNKGPYIIVLMSKDLKGEDSGVETLADISKVVYDYFNTK